jgi:AcrR family transcriptional regulator
MMNINSVMSTGSAAQLGPGTRAARRRQRTKRELLTAAKAVFAARGYHQTKISDIAAEADVGVGTVYLHYDGKEALFLELVEDTTRELKERVDRAKVAAGNPVDQARVSCETFFRFAQENRETFRIVFGEGIFNSTIATAQKVFLADVAQSVTAGMRQGLFAPYPTALIAQAVVGLLTQVVSWWITQDEVSLEEAIEATNRFIAQGILARAVDEARRS